MTLLPLHCTLCQLSCVKRGLIAVAIVSKNTNRFKKKSTFLIVVIPYVCRTRCSFAAAGNVVVESALVSRCGQSLAVSPSPFLLHWVPSRGQHGGEAALGELSWPRSAPWHGELAGDLGCQERCSGGHE